MLTPGTPVISTAPACEGTMTYTYTYTDCEGNIQDWVYTYTIDHVTAPIVPTSPAAVTVACESLATPPSAPTGVVDVCGTAIIPSGPVVGGTASLNVNNFSTAVVIGPTAAPGIWYTDRYAPAGFVSPVIFGGDSRLMHSIAAADGASTRPPAYSDAFYNTQGRGYDHMANTSYVEIDLYIPTAWATTNKRMAGLWGVAADNASTVSGYPIVEFTSDVRNQRFRAWESEPVYGLTWDL